MVHVGFLATSYSSSFVDTLATLASMILITEGLWYQSWCNRQGHPPTVFAIETLQDEDGYDPKRYDDI